MSESSAEASMADEFPDPFPKRQGMTNREWADQLLGVMDSRELTSTMCAAYLTRALDIACMYSTRPKDRFMDQLVAKLERAATMIESVSFEGSKGVGFVKDCRALINQIRSYSNGA